jgi:hypothetical protein
MTRRAHHPPKPYRPKPSRSSEHYHHRRTPDDGEQDLLARAYGLYLADREDDQ